MSDKRPPGSLGLDLRPRSLRACGLCGETRQMTKAHVPPQAAGNGRAVTSANVRIVDGAMRHGRHQAGGMWLRGLCADCNSLAGLYYDQAYSDFARRLRTHARLANRMELLEPRAAPAVSVAPGLVARSVLFGMFAINPHLRVTFPGLAEDLLNRRRHFMLPEGAALRFALYPYRAARLTGPVHAERVLTRRENYHTFAEVFFAPLAWVLTPQDRRGSAVDGVESVLDLQGWADACTWPRYGADVTSTDLRDLVRRLPLVRHPLANRSEWIEMFSDQTAFLEGFLPA